MQRKDDTAEALKARYDVGYRLVVTLRQPHLTIAANEKEKESVAASLLSSFEKAIPSSPVDTKGGARARVTRDGTTTRRGDARRDDK